MEGIWEKEREKNINGVRATTRNKEKVNKRPHNEGRAGKKKT